MKSAQVAHQDGVCTPFAKAVSLLQWHRFVPTCGHLLGIVPSRSPLSTLAFSSLLNKCKSQKKFVTAVKVHIVEKYNITRLTVIENQHTLGNTPGNWTRDPMVLFKYWCNVLNISEKHNCEIGMCCLQNMLQVALHGFLWHPQPNVI